MNRTETELALQRALDLNPGDAGARAALVDYLLGEGDIRAEGYDAMRRLGKRPSRDPSAAKAFRLFPPNDNPKYDDEDNLPQSWWENFSHLRGYNPTPKCGLRGVRADLEDGAALAFSLLPREERQRLLEGV